MPFPAAMVDTIAHSQVNESLSVLVREVAPDTLFLPFAGDLHLDHQLIFLSGLVASRPNREQYPRRLLAYETLSETNWNAPYLSPPFAPNLYIDIGDMLERKLEAMACYASQLRPAPNERSIEALRALARLRGAAVHRHAAEAFVLLREVG
jgi:LmbE family N-acetylglucosaminyl deacetylase